MSASNKVYYRNLLTMLSGNTLSQLIPFIIAPILSRIFSPEEFAVLANFMAIVGGSEHQAGLSSVMGKF
jgi:O-antigen/teichoic acid export membrane protein